MSEPDVPSTEMPSPRAVRWGRFIFCLVGSFLLFASCWYSYHNPQSQVLLTALCMGFGLILIWLGISLPPRLVAHFGFWLAWFIPSE
jgi:hypothetical protein